MPLEFPLRSERLELRPVEATDLEAAHRVYGDAEVMRHPASARVLEKLGFLRRGTVTAFGRPHHCFELAPAQVVASNPPSPTPP